MDAGARGRRLLQRREYRAKVSEFIPKELEDQFSYDKNGQLVYELDLKKTAQRVKQGLKNWWNKPVINNPTKNQHLDKIRNSGGDPSHWQDSHNPEGEMIEANSEQMKAMQNAKVKKMEDDKVASKKKIKEGTKYGLYKGSGKASGAFKDYLDKKKKEKKKVEEAKKSCVEIDEKKKLFNTAPLGNRVSNWSAKNIKEASPLTPGRNAAGLPNLKSIEKKIKNKNTGRMNTGGDGTAYQGEQVVQEMPDDLKNVGINALKNAAGQFSKTGKVDVKGTIRTAAKNALNTKTVTNFLNKNSYEPQGEMIERKMTSCEKDKKEKYVKGMKKVKDDFTKRYGKDGKSVMYATATKMAMKKEGYGDVPFRDGRVKKYLGKDNISKIQLTNKGKQAFKNIPDPKIFSGNKAINPDNAITNLYKTRDRLSMSSYEPEGEMTEAKYEKGASNYGKASIRNKRMFGKGGNAADPKERGAAITVRKARHQERRYVKKGNKYHEPGKHRPEVHGVNKPEEERKGKNVKENAVVNKIMNDLNFVKKAKDTVGNYNKKLKQNNDAINKVMPGSATLN